MWLSYLLKNLELTPKIMEKIQLIGVGNQSSQLVRYLYQQSAYCETTCINFVNPFPKNSWQSFFSSQTSSAILPCTEEKCVLTLFTNRTISNKSAVNLKQALQSRLFPDKKTVIFSDLKDSIDLLSKTIEAIQTISFQHAPLLVITLPQIAFGAETYRQSAHFLEMLGQKHGIQVLILSEMHWFQKHGNGFSLNQNNNPSFIVANQILPIIAMIDAKISNQQQVLFKTLTHPRLSFSRVFLTSNLLNPKNWVDEFWTDALGDEPSLARHLKTSGVLVIYGQSNTTTSMTLESTRQALSNELKRRYPNLTLDTVVLNLPCSYPTPIIELWINGLSLPKISLIGQ